MNSGEYQQLPVDASGKSMLQLENWQLPEVLQVAVAVGPDGSGIQIPGMNPIVETETAIAVPVVPTVC
jgi:hypothetical protein